MDQNGYNYTPQQPNGSNDGKGLAVGSLVLGIVSLALAFGIGVLYPAIFGVVCGIVGIVLAVLARKKTHSGIATAGLVTSIIGTVINAIGSVSCALCLGAAAGAASSLTLY